MIAYSKPVLLPPGWFTVAARLTLTLPTGASVSSALLSSAAVAFHWMGSVSWPRKSSWKVDGLRADFWPGWPFTTRTTCTSFTSGAGSVLTWAQAPSARVVMVA